MAVLLHGSGDGATPEECSGAVCQLWPTALSPVNVALATLSPRERQSTNRRLDRYLFTACFPLRLGPDCIARQDGITVGDAANGQSFSPNPNRLVAELHSGR